MRFRKRVKIVKGLYLNFSNTGVSTSVGVRGASLTFGKKGTFLNTGIPGTGLSNRTKISGSHQSSSAENSVETIENPETNSGLPNNVKVERSKIIIENGVPTAVIQSYYGDNWADYKYITLNKDGEPEFFNSDGTIITDKSYCGSLKRDRGGKEFIEQLVEMRQQEITGDSQKFIDIVKLTPLLIIKNTIEEKLKNLQPKQYIIQQFNITKPSKDEIIKELSDEANKLINHKILFWKNKDEREKYVNENFDNRLKENLQKWESQKNEFLENEKNSKLENDKIYLNEYIQEKTDFENFLFGNEGFIEEKIANIINEITAPVEINLDYEYNETNHELKIDLDLPEIEELPKTKSKILSTGKLSIKEKTQKEVNQDYVECVCGLAIFLVGTFFNVSNSIQVISVSGYTTRINKSNGNPQNEYIYSIQFTRDLFQSMNFKNIVASEMFNNFKHNMQLSKDYNFKTISPI